MSLECASPSHFEAVKRAVRLQILRGGSYSWKAIHWKNTCSLTIYA